VGQGSTLPSRATIPGETMTDQEERQDVVQHLARDVREQARSGGDPDVLVELCTCGAVGSSLQASPIAIAIAMETAPSATSAR